MAIEEEIRAIEEEISKTKYNKATEGHIGRLKSKVARLRDEVQKRASSKSGGEGFSVKKSGDASVVLVGFPSVGKSTLLNSLTGTESAVAAYEFTTLDVVPGAMEHKGATIQVLDVPGLVRGAASGRGRGKEVIAVIRNADLAVILLDVFQLVHYDVLLQELYEAGIRVNSRPPDITIKKKARGGVNISSTVDLDLDEDTIKTILGEYRIHNANILIRENITIDQLIDAVLDNRKYLPGIVVINKIDLADEYALRACKEKFPDAILVSADKKVHIEELKDKLFENLGFIRIFMKPQGKAADMEEAMIIRYGATIGDVCDKLHRDFRKRFRYAQIWGTSAKHEGQRAGLDHIMDDNDILTLVMRR
ncbi:MAG: GTP-binding protein [Candidatus Methanoperedens nitroreducens]|uniref:GTP-binding protein n=1 Tax=Candidatus Methanoperedens nitratireducens TaxID=1392998 RepID=A0A0P8ACD9_9EURY|nr:GTP-binding protein [Candidatus Methanoperedens sp. BLZ2]KAB2947551.1 MAG: GTP-binding protein [Candidatus Methanoperedens sp.]KPQ41744.1 MAG: GTP-binding protein [Candidatus Methanoperedens sp. BLZ1]MBZ0177562.1 GTP-binding protein [Candidatus Methanoperedens nitroreducens]MCX9078046.1 GTP-binding protein [Candidatus Methanoperedens sp.]MCX9086229.1 GTP-binding protein [Candidatus Methanoperedens sp.]